MFIYFFTAYKYEIYNVRNKITLEKLRKLKPMQKFLLGFMLLCLVIYIICAFFFQEFTLVVIPVFGLFATTIFAEVSTHKYNEKENTLQHENYMRAEINKVKALLQRPEFLVFNSEKGVDFLISSCKEMMLKKTMIEDMWASIANIIKIIAVPIVLAVFSVQIKSMSAYEAFIAAAFLILVLIFALGIISFSFFPLVDILKRSKTIAAELSKSLKYIKLTVETDAKGCAKLIL